MLDYFPPPPQPRCSYIRKGALLVSARYSAIRNPQGVKRAYGDFEGRAPTGAQLYDKRTYGTVHLYNM